MYCTVSLRATCFPPKCFKLDTTYVTHSCHGIYLPTAAPASNVASTASAQEISQHVRPCWTSLQGNLYHIQEKCIYTNTTTMCKYKHKYILHIHIYGESPWQNRTLSVLWENILMSWYQVIWRKRLIGKFTANHIM